jgi:hypothetical protein
MIRESTLMLFLSKRSTLLVENGHPKGVPASQQILFDLLDK